MMSNWRRISRRFLKRTRQSRTTSMTEIKTLRRAFSQAARSTTRSGVTAASPAATTAINSCRQISRSASQPPIVTRRRRVITTCRPLAMSARRVEQSTRHHSRTVAGCSSGVCITLTTPTKRTSRAEFLSTRTLKSSRT